jgi:Tfp pilus assembly protein PilF
MAGWFRYLVSGLAVLALGLLLSGTRSLATEVSSGTAETSGPLKYTSSGTLTGTGTVRTMADAPASATWINGGTLEISGGTLEIPPVLTGPPQNFPEVENAIQLFVNRDFDEALAELKVACQKDPNLPPAQVIMAQLYGRIGQTDKMRESLERAVTENPNDPEAYVFLASMNEQGKRIAEADLLYSKAADLLVTFTVAKRKQAIEPRVLGGLAWVAETREDWPPAEKRLNALLAAVQKLPEDTAETKKAKNSALAAAMVRMAHARFQQKAAAESLDWLKRAYKIDPDNLLAPQARLALYYEQIGGAWNHREAERWMKIAVAGYPNDLRTRLAAARWALETGQMAEAKAQATKALEIDQASLEALAVRGIVALFQKDFKAAERDFENACLQKPDEFAASNNLALALCQQDEQAKKARARDCAEDNLRKFPKSAEAASTYGWVLYRLGRLPEADLAMRHAAELSSGTLAPDTAYYMAQIAYDLGKKDNAKQLVNAILRSDRTFSMRPEAQQLKTKIDKEESSEKGSR